MRLSPRDPFAGFWYVFLGDAELGLGHFDAAIDAYHKSITLVIVLSNPTSILPRVCASRQDGRGDARLGEARRLNPKLTIKWLQTVAPNLPPLFEGVRKAGLPQE